MVPSSSQDGKSRNLEDVLPPGAVLAIKEPYCEATSVDISGMCVDHCLYYLSERHKKVEHQFDDPSVSLSESPKSGSWASVEAGWRSSQ